MKEPDIQADKIVEDRDKSITFMEPMLISTTSRFRPELADLALELTVKSTELL